MIEHPVYTERVIAVKKSFQCGRRFVPCATHLGKPFGLNYILAVNVSTVYRIKHIIRLVVGRAVEPEFPHRKIHLIIMKHTVAHHGRRNTFSREFAVIFTSLVGEHCVEHIHYKLSHSGADIPKHFLGHLGTLHGHTCIKRQIRHEIISATFHEFGSKIVTPVLASAFPAVDMHVL